MQSFKTYLNDGDEPNPSEHFVNHLHANDETPDHLTEARKPKSGPSIMDLHKDVQFYDYTKNAHRVMKQSDPSHPENYHLALSHTGSESAESNDHHVAKALEAGHVVATIYPKRKYRVEKIANPVQGGPKSKRHPITPAPTHIKDAATGRLYPIINGDTDDNIFDRHAKAGIPHTRGIGHSGQGVGSGLELKGVSAARAGKFANAPNEDGHIVINGAKEKTKKAEYKPIDWSKMPNAARIRDMGQADMTKLVPAGTHIHTHMRKGLAKAYNEISTMDAPALKKRTAEAASAYKAFRQSRGVAGGANLMASNGKTEKSTGEGVSTIGLAMAPHHLSGFANVCPHSTAECRANCLGTEAGSLRGDANVSAKMIRTQFVHLHPEHAGYLLHNEITNHKKAAKKKGMLAGVRLNMISDIDHENIHN